MTMPLAVEVDDVSDRTLLIGFGSGNATSAAAFVRRFQTRVYGVAVSVVGDRGTAEDVAQEAFVRAWRQAATYDPGRGTVTAWLLRITRNLAIDTLRRRHPRPADATVIAALTPADRASTVEDAGVISELTAQAGAAIARLPHQQAEALILAAFYGYTAQQIATSAGIPLGTAKTRIRLGLRRVRAQLSNQDATEPGPFATDTQPTELPIPPLQSR
jgi:RNA polymerase sigma-70 factor (ECF subfamily)